VVTDPSRSDIMVGMERPSWAPAGIDLDRPNAARMYDYALGGSHNFAVDREAVERVEAIMPGSSLVAHANRGFLRRAVRFCLDEGIRQFLDLGAGIPTVGSLHEVAQARIPGARVVYVDVDPVAVAHGRAILADNPYATALAGDVRKAGELLADPAVTTVLDLSQPVAVLLIAVLHFIPDEDDPAAIVAGIRDRLAPGSFLALSHGCRDDSPDVAEQVKQAYRSTATPLALRTRAQIEQMLTGFDLVEPGLAWVTGWRPDEPEPERREMLAGVGRKR
jgi:SAM-dependent methyltransferase